MSRMRGVCAAVDISIHAHIAAATTRLHPCVVMFRHSLSAVGIVSRRRKARRDGHSRRDGACRERKLGRGRHAERQPSSEIARRGSANESLGTTKRTQRGAAGRAGCPAEGVCPWPSPGGFNAPHHTAVALRLITSKILVSRLV